MEKIKLPYKFADENRKYLKNFLELSKDNSLRKYCNLPEHQIFSILLPLKTEFLNHVNDECKSIINLVDLTESDDDTVNYTIDSQDIGELNDLATKNKVETNHLTVNDTLHLIKENLQIEKDLSYSTLNNLLKSECDQSEIFKLLSEELEVEEIIILGNSLKIVNTPSTVIITYYLRYLLIRKLFVEYSDNLQDLLNDLSIKFHEVLLEELSQALICKESYPKVFLQFVAGLNPNFKQELLKKMVTIWKCLQENYIPLIEILVVHQVEFETLSKLVTIFSISKEFNTDKSYGKLLTNVIKLLGRNVILLEQPLKHIIRSHRSVWKPKMQKTFDDCLQKSLILSQSFRF